MTEEDLKTTETVIKRAEDLAQRWVRAWGNHNQYASNVTLDFKERLIRFDDYYVDGVKWSPEKQVNTISFDYFFNDSTLEKDSKEQEYIKKVKRQERSDKLARLQKSSDVQEYLKLNNFFQGYII